MKNIFGELKLTWKKIIIYAIVIGIVIGLLNCVPALFNSSFRDPAIYFDLWILFGILIIMNAKSNLDSALKCFVFFLISQPLIYLVEVPFNDMGWGIFVYYKPWFIWTILTLPMGFIGYYMKKDKWWGLLILLPMMFILTNDVRVFMDGLLYSFPRHMLSLAFCIASLVFYPIYLFTNKFARITGAIIGIIASIVMVAIPLVHRPYYETQPVCSKEENPFDDTYKVSLGDDKFGEATIVKHESELENGEKEVFYCINTKFAKTGKTEIILESPEGEKKIYDIEVGSNTYDIEERENQE